MLALAWPWHDGAREPHASLLARLRSSLCAGIGGHAGEAEVDGLLFAYRPLRSTAAQARAWRPAILPSGRIVVFHGYFDNASAIASELGADARDVARLYGLAVERWGDDTEKRVIGDYCAVVAEPDRLRLRLSRSPLRAPPLYYFHDGRMAAIASVPRALFAAGAPQRLNETRVADSALINFSDREACWFEGILRVPLGHVVELQRGQPRVLRECYDLFAAPDVRFKTDAEYVARAGELLDEGVRACVTGFRKPGATLSGGLDSPQVAIRALAALPPGQRLPTFTFHPEKGFDGRVDYGNMPDERPFVEALAAMHPRIDPHFTANEGYGHDHRWNEFFHLMGGAPSGLCNMYVFHGLFAGAADNDCDVLLLAEWGNYTFSDLGNWGFVEYFLTGKWRQLWLALTRVPHDERPLWAKFLVRCILPLLPTSVWRLLRRIAKPNDQNLLDLMQPLNPEYRIASGAERRLKESGVVIERYQPLNRRQAMRHIFRNGGGEAAAIYQAFEQMYGVAQRDPTAYRPFVEFCLGLPTEMFLRDGHRRWLAKELSKGIMPEEQRANRLNGRWDSDWHLRISRQRSEYLAELDRLAGDERLASMLDVPRLRAALEDWPDHTVTDPQMYFGREFAVPRALLTARFIQYVEGRNAA
jgi:asparagine synthase (glutamine-hydrolysing)